MLGEESESHYEVVFKDGEYLISGKSKSDGEKISFENLHFSEKTATTKRAVGSHCLEKHIPPRFSSTT